jgi:antirestriction protein
MSASHEHEQPKDWPQLNPRIWIASLSDYNAGRLHGGWVNAAVEADQLHAAVQRVLASSPDPDAEEWAIFDYDNFGSYRLGEYSDLAAVAAVARGIERHGFAFASWAELSDADVADLETEFEDVFMGHFDSRELFADSVLQDFDVEETLTKGLPAWITSHISIDRAAVARELETSGDLTIEDAPAGGIYVFRM